MVKMVFLSVILVICVEIAACVGDIGNAELKFNVSQPSVCGTNEVYSECGATGCVNTCSKPTFSQISRCACNPGCICIDGYLRNSENVCVAPQQCEKLETPCQDNAEFSACGNHGCQNTCEETDLLPRCDYVAGCYPGCICRKGYLRNNRGDCVAEQTCIQT